MTTSIISTDISRHRVIGAAEAASFCNFSLPHWRRLARTGEAPKPLHQSARKVGWRVGDLLDWIDTKAREAA